MSRLRITPKPTPERVRYNRPGQSTKLADKMASAHLAALYRGAEHRRQEREQTEDYWREVWDLSDED